MPERRRYTKREKLAAVMAAELSGVTVAGETTGIPKTTIQYWTTRPEFAQFRTKTREDMQDEVKVVAHLAWKRIAETLASGEMEPRDAIFAAEKSSSLLQLLAGDVTSRSEVSTFHGYNDHEKRAIADLLRKALAGDGATDPSEADAVGAGVETPGPAGADSPAG
jgi:hypothetical protein